MLCGIELTQQLYCNYCAVYISLNSLTSFFSHRSEISAKFNLNMVQLCAKNHIQLYLKTIQFRQLEWLFRALLQSLETLFKYLSWFLVSQMLLKSVKIYKPRNTNKNIYVLSRKDSLIEMLTKQQSWARDNFLASRLNGVQPQ